MNKNKYIEDDYLEKIGVIKDIDTLSIIKAARQGEENKELRIQDFIYAFSLVFAVIVEISILYKFGVKVCLVLNFIMTFLLPLLVLIKPKNYMGGGIVK
ncbi:hypothetical protein [Clostridium felsineum]|uniref:Uncharacterized protein n=1 Tax=Clostridium felsineum TaxID=36839 RepID=A0A1S8KYQ2_9CLOT|nr:hypothetical protein [Clostridium felsineum]URZ07812.1 hypothetical protein CLROS_031730 [Clostridium felsineum]URZ12843.1 hypothetical protein CROST_035880 [Clostridium felsineum]